jgi:superfamily II DNA helicase RecQ
MLGYDGYRLEMFLNEAGGMAAQQPSQFLPEALIGLQKFWGYDQFRPLQGEIVTSLLQGQDTLVMLPTGAGKSLCFQLPALLQEGLTLVVSPLVALMENQVQALKIRHAAVALLHSEQSREQRQQTLHRLDNRQLKLLYLSPESLLSLNVWERLFTLADKIESLVIDEAHCITQWGSSFRPSYRRLGSLRPALLQQLPQSKGKIAIAAFTATADPTTQQDIRKVLGLTEPQCGFGLRRVVAITSSSLFKLKGKPQDWSTPVAVAIANNWWNGCNCKGCNLRLTMPDWPLKYAVRSSSSGSLANYLL